MINRIIFHTLCLATFLATAVAPAWAASLADVIQTLETPFQAETDKTPRIFDYSADFSQESKIASLNRLQSANGRVEVAFDYRRGQSLPGVKFRWQYEQPTTQEIVSDGETLWVYLPENNQVIQSSIEMVNQSQQNDPMTFLTGLGNLSRDFQIGWAEPSEDVGGNSILELVPLRVSALINRLVIVVDRFAIEAYERREQAGDKRAGFPVISTTIYDPNGNSTVIEFSNLSVNLGIPEKTFDFTMPEGVQVVRPTGKEMGF